MTTKKKTTPKKRQNTKAKSKKPTKKQVQAAIAATDNAMEQNLLVRKKPTFTCKKFNEEEDLMICRAVINTTLDLIKGCDQ